jgi:hypothetical protein
MSDLTALYEQTQRIIEQQSHEARLRHDGVLPPEVKIKYRRFGKHGYRYEAHGPGSTAFCGHDYEAAMFEAWWMVACMDNENARKAQAGG